MLASFVNIFKVPDLRKKVLFTISMCVVYRIGAHVPIPFINPESMQDYFQKLTGGSAGGVLNVVDMFSGGAFSQMTIFALGIMPYISASIILQLLQVVWPKLEKISKEGEAGRKKITQWTRYGTVVLSLFQGVGIGIWLQGEGLAMLDSKLVFIPVAAITMCAGTCFVMWLGEKITEHGIGNGISLIIAIGILAEYPRSLGIGITQAQNEIITWLAFVTVMVSMVLFSALIVINQVANRRIPVQHARQMVGRRVMQGGTNFLPLKLNTAGVIPVIFSSAMLTFPQFFVGFLPESAGGMITEWFSQSTSKNLYYAFDLDIGGAFNLLKVVNLWTLAYIVLTTFFCFFYTALTFNPVDLADNLKKSGAFIPGRKPGKATSEYINYVLVRITTVGAALLVIIALVPDVFAMGFGIPYSFAMLAGGTGLIIVVGVLLDLMKQIESQLLMRHYEGFKYRGSGRRSRR